jgi:hypothetical protein
MTAKEVMNVTKKELLEENQELKEALARIKEEITDLLDEDDEDDSDDDDDDTEE